MRNPFADRNIAPQLGAARTELDKRHRVLILIDETDPKAPREHRFRQSRVRIGRVAGNDLVLGATHISSRHAEIRLVGERHHVSDLGSTNGSLVQRGEQRLLLGPKGAAEIALEPGDVLVLGDIDSPVRLRVQIAPEQQRGEQTIVAARTRPQSLEASQRLTGDSVVLRALFGLVDALNAATDRQQVLDEVVRAALRAIPGAVDALLIAGPKDEPSAGESAGSRQLHVLARAHLGEGISGEPHDKICKHALEAQQALLFGQQSRELPAATLVERGLGSGIVAPLFSDQRAPIGVLQVNCMPGQTRLGEAQLDLVVVLAHHAASALRKAELIEKLRAAERKLAAENAFLRTRTQPHVRMIATSPRMEAVVRELSHAASADVTVLLSGETGTGKEVAARYLHERSHRRDGLLVPVNCGALTETLLDSELFGHRRGAFTGATSDRKGVFEVAEGGTVFLDEIGETPLALQVRLLRVLEESKIKRVGEAIERRVDVRVIAATNRDLAQMVERDRFRRDLYYRLRVFPIALPPLRDRREDIAPLCHMFSGHFAEQQGKRLDGVDPSFVAALERYDFPGNVRELANEIERAVVRAESGQPLTADLLSEEVLAARSLAPAPSAETGGSTLRDLVASYERAVIARCLARHAGKKTAAAAELGLTRQGLAKKMSRLGLE